MCFWYIFLGYILFVFNSGYIDFHKVQYVTGLLFNSCLFLPSLAPHNAPTNNAVTTGLIDGAVVSGIGTGKYSSMTVSSVLCLMFSSLMFLCQP